MKIFSRMGVLLGRRRRARHLGFHFQRAAGFVAPASLQIGADNLQLRLPKDRGSRTAFVDILLDDCYRLDSLPSDIESVVDIGAHAGLFSIAARKRWPHAEIHSYEPNPDLLGYWHDHSIQACFRVFPEAVGLNDGFVSLVSDSESVQTRSKEEVDRAEGAIRQVSFAEVVARHGGAVDLVKLDCEGAEWQILRDSSSWRKVRYLTMEFHLWADYTLEDLQARIRALGFSINHCEFGGDDFGLLSAHRP